MNSMTAEEALKHPWFEEQLGENALHVKSNHVISAHSRRMVANFSEYLAKQKLKKMALNFIASDLTEAEAEPVLEIFQKITKSEKDVISLKELDVAICEGKDCQRGSDLPLISSFKITDVAYRMY